MVPEFWPFCTLCAVCAVCAVLPALFFGSEVFFSSAESSSGWTGSAGAVAKVPAAGGAAELSSLVGCRAKLSARPRGAIAHVYLRGATVLRPDLAAAGSVARAVEETLAAVAS